jgi:nitroreductase
MADAYWAACGPLNKHQPSLCAFAENIYALLWLWGWLRRCIFGAIGCENIRAATGYNSCDEKLLHCTISYMKKETMMDLATVDHLLTTTRSVRKRLDLTRPVEPEVIEHCLDLAIQAPSGSDRQSWHFVVITAPELRMGIADLYRQSFARYRASAPAGPVTRLQSSSDYLAEHFHEVPMLVLFCYEGRVEQAGLMAQAALYGSILPAAWSFMLALRARGLGSAWTTLHLRYEQEAAQLLGLPASLTQAALLPVAYYLGDDFQPAKRVPTAERTFWNGWGQRRREDAR